MKPNHIESYWREKYFFYYPSCYYFLFFYFCIFIILSFFLLLAQVHVLKEKQEQHRDEAISDSEQMIAELNHRHEREKQMLLSDNRKLVSNVELVSFFSFCALLFFLFCLNFIFVYIYLFLFSS